MPVRETHCAPRRLTGFTLTSSTLSSRQNLKCDSRASTFIRITKSLSLIRWNLSEPHGRHTASSRTLTTPSAPPTKERVEEFLKYSTYPPEQEIAVLPPSNLKTTPRHIAINGVMAGCLPEHMPVLIAALQCMVDPAFRYKDQGASTHGFTNF